MSQATLYWIPFSPWSQKARWALRHHRVSYRSKLFLPMVGTLGLRRATGRWRGPLTVPCWIGDEGVLMDSLAIARRAEALGDGLPLFPAGHEAEIEAWNTRSEAMLAAGRALTTHSVAQDPKALVESVPPPFGRLPGIGKGFGALGVRYLARKYGFAETDLDSHTTTLVAGLDALRAGLEGRETLLDRFSYADITMALALQFVQPTAWQPVGPASRPHWTRPALAAEYADLIAWRDRIIAAHHPKYGQA